MSADTFGKGPPIVATPNWSDPATIESYTGFDSDEDAERLQTPQPSDRAQSSGIAGGVEIVYNRGVPYPSDLVWMGFGNISETGSWLVQQANSVAELDTGPRRDTSEGFGAALRFDGGDATAAQTSTPFGLTAYSISARIRADLIWQNRGILKFGPAAGDYVYLQLDPNGYIRFRKSNGAMNIASLAPIEVGRWYRVTGVYGSGISGLIIDGVLQGTASGSVGGVATNQLVTLAPSDAARFMGSIDDVRLWDSIQSPASELTNKVGEMGAATPGLVGYWKLNELQGTSAANTIAGGPALTLSGSPLPYWSFPERYWTSPNLHSFARRHALLYDPQALTYAFTRIRVIDPQNADPLGFMHFGRAYVSASHQFTRGIRYGSAPLGSIDSSTRSRMPSGVGPFVRRGKRAQRSRISLQSTVQSEIYDSVNQLARLRGGSEDMLWVMRPYDEVYRHHSMIYGLDQLESEIPVENHGLWEHSHVIEAFA